MDEPALSRCVALRRMLWPTASPLPGAVPATDAGAWAAALVEHPEAQVGIEMEGLTPDWIDALSHVGVPLTAGRGLLFERVFTVEDVPAPVLSSNGPLRLPPAQRLRALTSLPLKPLRLVMAGLFGVRLQIGVGVHLFLSRHQVVLLNTSPLARSGFLHGPRRGMRTALAMDPGEAQTITL